MSTPFYIVPWDTDFFQALHRLILELTGERPERALVVFPNDRPRRYLHEIFAKQGTPTFMPRIVAVRELFAALRSMNRPAREAGLIDRVALVHTCCRDVSGEDEPLSRRLTQGGEAAFFPWGEQLAALLEECLIQNLTPTDLHHAETEVAPFGADLLMALGRIFARYIELLSERGRSTPGLDAFLAVRRVNEASELPPFLRNKVIVLSGFHMLTGTEEALFKMLWRNGAHCVLHTDAGLSAPLEQASYHWSCEIHAQWIRKWRACVEPACPPSGKKPALHFFAGHDLHSQLFQLSEDLNAAPHVVGPQAVALTHPELLLPVLHHLPEKDCNIALGYPLERSSLHRLMDCMLRLVEERTAEGLVPWRTFSELVCHPWMRLLALESQEENAENSENRFALLMRCMDGRIRSGSKFQDVERIGREALGDLMAREYEGEVSIAALESMPEATLLNDVLEWTVLSWARARSLADMADCLSGFTELLATHAPHVWQSFPVDAECLIRLARNVIPPLRDNDLAQTDLPVPLRHAMLRALMRDERVPFEADPITGLQVLGMLETRLLSFSRIFIVDATDAALPGPSSQDPLLPDSLRGIIGLPDGHQREQLAAHTFYRLLAGANEAYLYWREGSQASGLLDGISQRSRLVEELIWREECKAGRLLKPGDPPLRTAAPRLRPPRRERPPLLRAPAVQTRLGRLLAAPLSPARLDAYLSCPLSFYYRHVARLTQRDEVREGDEPSAVGELIHDVLHEAYRPFTGKVVRPGDITGEALRRMFVSRFATTGMADLLPPESAVMLELAGPERLRRYVAGQPERIHILSLEEEVAAPFTGWGVKSLLHGRLDRVDKRADGLVILDYKTGSVHKPVKGFWQDSPFWETLSEWLDASRTLNDAASGLRETGDALLREVAASCPSVQLACYIHMCGHAYPGEPIHDAVWVELRDNGEEVPIFEEGMDAHARARACEDQIPRLLAFVIRHMVSSPYFLPLEGIHCSWCSFKNLCIVIG